MLYNFINPRLNFMLMGNNIYTYIIIFIILLILYLLLRKQYNRIARITSTKYIINDDEICNDCAYYVEPVDKVKYILWSGGYKSTFLLCWYFIIKEEAVQPIYIMSDYITKYKINEYNTTMNNPTDDLEKLENDIIIDNQYKDLNKLKIIRKTLINRYPYKKSKLLPTYYIHSINKKNNITSKFIYLHKNFFPMNTNKKIYDRIIRLSLEWKFPIHIGIEQNYISLDKLTSQFLINIGSEECMIDPNISEYDNKFQIFKNLRFTIIHVNKEDMKQISLHSDNYFYDLLLIASK
jgi:hypothetical protein